MERVGNVEDDICVHAKEEKCHNSQHQHYKTDKNNGSNSAGPVIGYQTRPLVYRLANRRLSDITTPLCRYGFPRLLRGRRSRDMASLWLRLDDRSRLAALPSCRGCSYRTRCTRCRWGYTYRPIRNCQQLFSIAKILKLWPSIFPPSTVECSRTLNLLRLLYYCLFHYMFPQ